MVASKKPALTPDKSVISVRIPMQLREEIDAAVVANGRSLTDEIVARLRGSFAKPENGPNQEIFAALGKSIQKIERTGQAWRNDPWAAQQVALAAAAIVTELGAKGEPKPPEGLRTPEGVDENNYGEWVGQTFVILGDVL